ncbi:MAG: hypothetical protein JNL32_06195 [Candidatus Kapabacteria bacterium]|nr:hypothetical protein [Candidatus Kapabacteria bacterium]
MNASTYQSAYQNIISRLTATKNKETRLTLTGGVLTAVALSVTVLILFATIEAFANGSKGFRLALFSLWLLTTVAAFGWFVGLELWRRVFSAAKPTVEGIALRVGTAYSDVRDMLLNAMQLVPMIESAGGSSPSLALAAFGTVDEQTRTKDFDVIINKESLKRAVILVLIALGAGGGLMSFTPLGAAATRILNFKRSYLPPAPFGLKLSVSSSELLRGEKVTITVKASGIAPQNVTLQLKEGQQENFDAYTLTGDSSGVFRFESQTLKKNITFFAESPWHSEMVTTDTITVSVTDRPMVRTLEGRVSQPSYTGLPSQQLNEQNADISCLAGSRADLRISANKELKSARLVFVRQRAMAADDTSKRAPQNDTSFLPMSVNGREASTGFSVISAGQYWIELRDNDNRTNADPIKYSVTVTTDGFPSISMIEPITDANVNKEALLTIRAAITDDYGFSQLLIKYRLAESRYAMPEKNFKSVSIPLANVGTSADVPYVWDLNKIGISPDDRYEFYLEVFDNDRITGPKSAKTSTLSVRLPSLDEVFRQAQQTQKDAVKELEQVMKKAEDVAKDMEQLQRDLMKQKQMQAEWKDKKKMEDLLKQQQQIEEKVKDVQQKLEEMTQQLEENKALSPETMQKYMELQKLMQKIDSKELREQMEKMQQAMQQMSPEQMQQAMKNFKFNEDDFKKQIERTMQLLKRIQTEQKVDELTKRADELQRQQEQLEKQAENTNPNDKNSREELAKKQDALKDDFKKLTQELNELQKMMKESGLDKQQNVADEMKKAQEQLNQEMTEKQMQQSEQNLEQGEMEKAQQNMKNAQQNMKNFAQSMKKMKQEMKKNLQRETARQMQASLNDMMQLSKAQEQLMKESQQMDANSAKMSQNAQRQQKLMEQMGNLANRMDQLGQKSTAVTPEMGKEMGDAMREMSNAQQSMEQRNANMAGQQQQQAMGSMNRAMGQMQATLQKMNGNNPGDGEGEGDGSGDQQRPGGKKPGQGQGGFMQRLQQAANMQQGINQGMQQNGGQGQGQGQGQGMSQQEMGRLIGQQGKVQKTLEELANEQKQTGGDKKALGNLEKLAQDMKEVLTDMQTGNITDETRRRQDKILSRLLDASRSMNERDYEKTRESRAGIDVNRKSPGALNLNDVQSKQAMQDLLRSMQQGYTKDYEQLIRAYFEKLQKSGAKQ